GILRDCRVLFLFDRLHDPLFQHPAPRPVPGHLLRDASAHALFATRAKGIRSAWAAAGGSRGDAARVRLKSSRKVFAAGKHFAAKITGHSYWGFVIFARSLLPWATLNSR